MVNHRFIQTDDGPNVLADLNIDLTRYITDQLTDEDPPTVKENTATYNPSKYNDVLSASEDYLSQEPRKTLRSREPDVTLAGVHPKLVDWWEDGTRRYKSASNKSQCFSQKEVQLRKLFASVLQSMTGYNEFRADLRKALGSQDVHASWVTLREGSNAASKWLQGMYRIIDTEQREINNLWDETFE
ncbi:hypothetical protein P7C73_g3865, partial [Tremellales sp. Uapishka_1]